MEWTDGKVLKLIEEYKARPVLWDPSSADYKLLNKKNDGWISLAAVMTTDVGEVKKKINSLLSSFRRERSKEKKKSYRSFWFAYKPMTFLMDKFRVKDTKNSEDIVQSNEEENDDDEINTTEFLDVQVYEFPEKQNQSTSSDRDLKRKANSVPPPYQSRMKKVNAQLKDVVDIKTVGNEIGANKPMTHKSMDDAFGEYIASKMREYSHTTKSLVQHKINNILFEADMGMYEQPAHTISVSVSQDSNSTTDYS